MLETSKLEKLHALVESASHDELIWINGYVSGCMSQRRNEKAADVLVTKEASSLLSDSLTILFGTETGNSKKIAQALASHAKQHGLKTKVRSLDQYPPEQISREKYLALVMSTHGEGDPPDAAKKFCQFINQQTLDLSALHYSVLALGDKAYPLFCKAGLDVDHRLRQSGAIPLLPVQTCDVDFEEAANHWMAELWQILATPNGVQQNVQAPAAVISKKKARKVYQGAITVNVALNDVGSEKEIHHLELCADDELVFSPGDAVAVVPPNQDADVAAFFDHVKGSPDSNIVRDHESLTAHEWLTSRLEISYLSSRVLDAYRKRTGLFIPDDNYTLLSLMIAAPLPPDVTVPELVNMLEPITPRLYSGASSSAAYPGEIHLTVARHFFETPAGIREGKASGYLATRKPQATVSFYIHHNPAFRLPAPEADIIMIGPGTGVAPFRAFLQEREQTGAPGRSWLFFGAQRFACDFLYQTEWQNLLNTGTLTRISLAFSRDQPEIVYVQHRMHEAAADLFRWIDKGAFLYICGARAMAIEVEETLLKIFEKEGGMSRADAESYLAALTETARYSKDVY